MFLIKILSLRFVTVIFIYFFVLLIIIFLKDDPLGSLTIPLNKLERGIENVQWYNLTGVRSGQVEISLTALDFGCE